MRFFLLLTNAATATNEEEPGVPVQLQEVSAESDDHEPVQDQETKCLHVPDNSIGQYFLL